MVDRPDTPRNRGDLDAPHVSPVSPAEDIRSIAINRISWGAVLAGVVLALVVQLILNMIGVGVGLSTLDPTGRSAENPSAQQLSIGAAIWWAVAGILAALAGGYAAGRLSGRPKESTAGWHGLAAWALTTLVIFLLLTSTIGGLIGGAYRIFTGALGGAGEAIQTTAQAAAPSIAGRTVDPLASIEQSIRSATGGNDPATLRDAAVAAVRAVVTGDQQQAADARNRAAEALAKAQNIPVEEAREQVERYEQQYRQGIETTKREAGEAATIAARAVSRGALIASLALILGAVAAWFGGRLGAVAPTITSPFGAMPSRDATWAP